MRKKVMSLLIALALVLGSAATVTNGFAEIGGGGSSSTPAAASFFEATGGTLAVSEDTAGLKLDLSGTGATASIKYKDAFPVSGLSEIIKMRVLPLTAGELDFNAVQFTVRDSVNPAQVVSVMIGKSNVWYGSKSTGGVVAFTDKLSYSGTDGYVGVTGTNQNAVGLDHWQGWGYSGKGNFHLANGYTANVDAWGTYYPLLAAPENDTKFMTIRYDGDGCIRLNNGKQDRNLAFINGQSYTNTPEGQSEPKTTDFYTASTANLDETDPAQAELKARYTTEYYENLFSSGKVTFEMKFIEIQNDRVSILLKSLCGTKLTDSWIQGQNDPVFIENATETTEGIGSVHKIGGSVVLPQTITKAQLASGITFQVLPVENTTSGSWSNGLSYRSAQAVQVIFRDSENPEQLINVIVSTGEGEYYGGAVTTTVALTDQVTDTAGQYVKVGKSKAAVIGFSPVGYNSRGFCSMTGSNKNQMFSAENTRALTIKYDSSSKKVVSAGDLVMDANGGAAAVLGNNFFTASKNGFYNTSGDETSELKNSEDQSIVDKYNAEWVGNLFSSNKIEIEFKFYVRWAGGAPDYNLIDKNASFKVLSLGGVSAAELSDKGEFADTLAPEVNATASIELEKGKAYEASDILALVSATATDNIDGEVAATKKLYNAAGEEQSGEVTPAADWYVGSTATDAAGNASALVKTTIALVDYYDVKFYNGDGSLMKTDHVRSGGAATAPTETPVKAGTTEKDYMFSGWDKAFDNVTENLEVYAQFTETAKQYDITFLNYDGTQLSKVKVPYGETPAYNGTPTRQSDETHDYVFSGWDPALAAVSGEATYTAQFRMVDKLLVKFVGADGSVLKSEYVSVGGTATAPTETPTKPSDVQYDYEFSGWDKSLSGIEEACEINAVFQSTLRKYEIVFRGEDGSELYKASFDYGTLPVYGGETPVKAPSGGYSYAFDGWTTELSAVSGEAEYTVKFRAIEVKYTVTFVVNGGDEIATATRTIFAAYTLPSATREGYTFKGWYDNAQLSGEAITEIAAGVANEGDKTFYAKWEEIAAPDPEPAKKGCGKQTARDLALMLGSLSALLAAALFVGKKG